MRMRTYGEQHGEGPVGVALLLQQVGGGLTVTVLLCHLETHTHRGERDRQERDTHTGEKETGRRERHTHRGERDRQERETYTQERERHKHRRG